MSECMLKLENIVAGYGYGPDIIKILILSSIKVILSALLGQTELVNQRYLKQLLE